MKLMQDSKMMHMRKLPKRVLCLPLEFGKTLQGSFGFRFKYGNTCIDSNMITGRVFPFHSLIEFESLEVTEKKDCIPIYALGKTDPIISCMRKRKSVKLVIDTGRVTGEFNLDTPIPWNIHDYVYDSTDSLPEILCVGPPICDCQNKNLGICMDCFGTGIILPKYLDLTDVPYVY